MAEILKDENPRKDLYRMLLADKTPGVADKIKKYSFNQFEKHLLSNEDAQNELGWYLEKKGVVSDPTDFSQRYIQTPQPPPAPKPQAAPVAPAPVEQEPYVPEPQPAIGSPEYDAQLQAQYGGMTPTLGATFGGVPAAFETKAQKKQEQISPAFKAQQLAFEDVPIAEEQRRAQRQFAKATKERQQAALMGGPGFEVEQKKRKKERGYGEWGEDVVGSWVEGGKRIGKNILSTVGYFAQTQAATDPMANLPYEKRQEMMQQASQTMYDNATAAQNTFQNEIAKRNIQTSVLQAINKGEYSRLPESVLYTVGDAAMQIIPSILTFGGSTYAQTLPQVYKDGVDAIAKEKGISPEQAIANGDDAFVVSQINAGVQSALEYAGAGLVSKGIASKGGYKAMRDWLLSQNVNRRLAQGAALLGVGTGEAATEYGQELTGQIGKAAAKSSTTKAFLDKLPNEIFTPEARNQRAEAFVGGLVGGLGLTGGGQAIQSAMDRTLFEAPKIGKATQRADYDVVQTDSKITERNKIAQAMEEAVKANPEAEGQIRQQYQKRINEAAPTDEEVLSAYESLSVLPETEEKNAIRENLEGYMAEKGIAPQAEAVTAEEITAPEAVTETAPIEELPPVTEEAPATTGMFEGIEGPPMEEAAPVAPAEEEVVAEEVPAEPIAPATEEEKQKSLEDEIESIKAQINSLRSEDGSVPSGKRAEFDRLVNLLTQATANAKRGNSTSVTPIRVIPEDIANQAPAFITDANEKAEAADLIEQAIQSSKTWEEAMRKIRKLGYVFDANYNMLLANYLKDRFNPDAPRIGNNKDSFQAWVNGKTDADLAAPEVVSAAPVEEVALEVAPEAALVKPVTETTQAISATRGDEAKKAMIKEIDSQVSEKENELIEKQKQAIQKAKDDLKAINDGDKSVISDYVKKSGYKLITKEVIAENPKSELIKKSEGKYYNSTGASIQVKTAEQIAIDAASKKANSKPTGSKIGANQYVDAYNAIIKFSQDKITAEEAKDIIEKAGLKIPKAIEQSLKAPEAPAAPAPKGRKKAVLVTPALVAPKKEDAPKPKPTAKKIDKKSVQASLDKAKEEYEKAKSAFDKKRSELDKTTREDVKDLFGQRKVEMKAQGLFEMPRISPGQREKIIQPFRDRMNKAKEEVNRLTKMLEEGEEVSQKISFNKAVEEIKSKPLSHVFGIKMGSNQAEGTYISTEKENRYAKSAPNAKISKAEVSIENPLVVTDDIGLVDLRNKILNRNLVEFTEEDFELYEIPDEPTVDDLNESGVEKLSKLVTKDLKAKGYDSIYFPESKIQEGELIVFDRKNVKFTEYEQVQRAGEKVRERKGAPKAERAVRPKAKPVRNAGKSPNAIAARTITIYGDPYATSLQYLMDATYHPDIIKAIWGSKGKEKKLKEEHNRRIQFLDVNSPIKKTDRLAEILAERYAEENNMEVEDAAKQHDFQSIGIEIITDYVSRKKMVEEVLRLNEQQNEEFNFMYNPEDIYGEGYNEDIAKEIDGIMDELPDSYWEGKEITDEEFGNLFAEEVEPETKEGKKAEAKEEKVRVPEEPTKKGVRFEKGKKLTEEEKKEVYKNLKDSYKEMKRPYTIETRVSQYTGRDYEARVWLENASDYMQTSDVTGRKLRYYIFLPDGTLAHPTEIFPNISASEMTRVQRNVEYNERQANEKMDDITSQLKKSGEIDKVVKAIETALKNGAEFVKEYDSNDVGQKNPVSVLLRFPNGSKWGILEYVINTQKNILGFDQQDVTKNKIGEARDKIFLTNYQPDWEQFYNNNKQAEAKPPAPPFTSEQSSEAATAFDKAKTSKGFDKKYGKGAYKALSDITKNFEDIMDKVSEKIKQDCII